MNTLDGLATLLMFNLRNAPTFLEPKPVLVNPEFEPRAFHTAIVRRNELLMLGGYRRQGEGLPILGTISTLSFSE